MSIFTVGLGLLATAASAERPSVPSVMPPAKVGRMHGYVMTHFYFAQPDTDPEVDCPGGMTMSLRDDFIAQLPPVDRERASQVTELGAKILGGNALQPTSTATTIRDDVVTDGPFIESKEALGGYYLIEANDLDQALAVAKLCPANQGGVEVRPIMVFD